MLTVKGKVALSAAMVALLAVADVGLGTPAFAQATHRFDIPAGPLGTAVARLGQQAGIVIAVDSALVGNRRTSGLDGNYTALAALDRILADSGLRAEADGQGGYRLVADRRTAAPASTPAAMSINNVVEQVVVVGKLTDVEITSDRLELRQATDLADIFRAVPSVAVGGGSVGIAQKIYVRGLEDSMLNVTVDGAPQRGTLFHHIGRVSIEPELLQTVEVQAGAGEATSGFGAIGGAIRFRTKNANELLAPGQTFGAITKATYLSNSGYKLSGTAYGQLFDNVGFVASLVHVDRSDVEDGVGNPLRGTAADQMLGFVKVGGELAEGHNFSLSYEHRNESGAFGQRPNWPVLAGERLFPAEGTRQTAVANYGLNIDDGLDVNATGYWTTTEFTQDRYDRWGLYGADITTFGFDLRGRLQRADHDIVAGVEYRSDNVVSQYLAAPAIWGAWAWNAAIGRFEEDGNVFGLYLQDHWQVAEPLTLSVGLRYDSYDLKQVTYNNGTDSDGVSFNAGLNYELLEGLSFNAGYAEAFRGKEIGDAFTLEKRPGRISLSPTLRPEKVRNYEAGLSYDQDGWRGSVVFYSMTIHNAVLDQIGSGAPPQDAVYYENVGKFRSEGVELRGGYTHERFSLDAYFNHYDSKLNGNAVEGYEHIGLGNSVGDNWNLTAGFKPVPDLDLEVSVTGYDDLNNLEVLQRNVAIGWIDRTQFVSKPGYTVLDFSSRWRPLGDDQFTLLLGVYNLFDRQYRAHASVADYGGIPDYEGVAGVFEPGRNVRLTAALRF